MDEPLAFAFLHDAIELAVTAATLSIMFIFIQCSGQPLGSVVTVVAVSDHASLSRELLQQ
jgi:hypothetical protein